MGCDVCLTGWVIGAPQTGDRVKNLTQALGLDEKKDALSAVSWLKSCANTHACHGYEVPAVVQDNYQFIIDAVRRRPFSLAGSTTRGM